MNDSSSKKIISDLARNIKDVFKHYSKNSRQKAWNILTNGEGEKQIKKIILDPNYPLSGFEKLNFKEWVEKLDIAK